MKRISLTFLAAIGVVTTSNLTALPSLACACCANPNTWYRSTHSPSEYESTMIDELSELSGWIGSWSLAKEPVITMNERAVPLSGSSIGENTWEFSFLLTQGTEAIPISFTFESDPEWKFASFDTNTVGQPPNQIDDTTALYKEVVISGNVVSEGESAEVFGSPQTQARLIFQGYGNACWDSSLFSSWILQILDPDTQNSLMITGAGVLSD